MIVLRYLLAALGTVWGTVFGARAILFLLIPWYKCWLPYMPRKVRRGNRPLTLHFIAGRLIPRGFDRTGDGDLDDPEDFITGGQTHWRFVWFVDEDAWNRAKLVKHEERHVSQESLLGPFFGLLYVGHFLVNLARSDGDVTKAYKDICLERDARRHAGQRV